ncbi:MAG: transposase, partial [Acidobacteriota bacterium]|nr:transposase [Acidobacteriota bacterium]
MQVIVQELLEAEMDQCIGAGRYERGEGRRGYRSGHYSRNLITRVGALELRVHQDLLVRVLRGLMVGQAPVPRLWHFPNAAPALVFIDGDGDA